MLLIKFLGFLFILMFQLVRPFFHSNKPRLVSFRLRSTTPRPHEINIPQDKVELRFSRWADSLTINFLAYWLCFIYRSSGAGGQNVNKLNTKAEVRFNVMEADWIPIEVRRRIIEYNQAKITNDGFLIVTSQEHRYIYMCYCVFYITRT